MPVKIAEVLMSDPPDFEVDLLTGMLDRLLNICDNEFDPNSDGSFLVTEIRDLLEAMDDLPLGDDCGPF